MMYYKRENNDFYHDNEKSLKKDLPKIYDILESLNLIQKENSLILYLDDHYKQVTIYTNTSTFYNYELKLLKNRLISFGVDHKGHIYIVLKLLKSEIK